MGDECPAHCYVHVLVGGPHDGLEHPSRHRYDWLDYGGVRYVRDDDCPAVEVEGNWEVLFVETGDSVPAVKTRVTMRFQGPTPAKV